MQGQILVVSTFILVSIMLIFLIVYFTRKILDNSYRKKVSDLEVKKNLVASTPVLLELSKVEPIIKNDKMEEKYNNWNNKFISLKENELVQIDDMLIDLDMYIEKGDYKTCTYRIAKTEMEIYKAKEIAETILEEVKEITLSEEKYRSIVTKLKAKYRKLTNDFNNHKEMYDDMQEAVALQLENIEKRFLDFEKVMDKNEYTEVVHIVKALDTMIDHMGIVVEEVPDILLMSRQIIPNRMKEIKATADSMVKEGFPIEYLNIDYNIEESKKNINTIIDKVKVLNLEDCMFELKTMLEYLDSLFVDFEKERLSRKVYEEIEKDFSKKLNNTNKVVDDIYNQLEDIKNMYDLDEDDIDIIHDVKKTLVVINDDYKKLLAKEKASSTPYSILHKEIDALTKRLKTMEEDLDVALKSLGNMKDDEERAREQLDEIKDFLKQCKEKMRTYKLPIITDNYFVELSEANEAIDEIIKELQRKPIVIKTLNTRVDTARDLVLKLYNTTNEMIKTAKLAEMAIVYGNRYRSFYEEVDLGLLDAEDFFAKGDYKGALDISIKSTSIVEKDIYQKLLDIYDN
ncbi:MAG: septation ring formation regulator EzrA [Bacilli bacterium]|nr:septation ring formation regulator EzrA [Bacilli bacterium]